jgi:PAS domain S-box-containing protein
MSSPPPASGDDASAEISMLIRALRETDQRIDDLTAGEVDTVADRDGRSFMLRHAQGEMRNAEAARQVAILNALPAHIILLDGSGVIVSVNDAWRFASRPNVLVNAEYTFGVNYLEMCDMVRGEAETDARRVSAGIRAVLSGSARTFSLEYSCGAPPQQAWYLLTVTPLNADSPAGAVVMHVDVTEQKRGEERSRRFSIAMDAIVDSIYLVDRATMRFVHVNDAACRMQNKTRAQLLATDPELILGASREELEKTYDELIHRGVDSKPLELMRHRADGACVWVEVRRQPQHSGDGWTIITLVRDVTERKTSDNRIAYLNRVYAMLSGINALIVREHDRDELFREACRIAVEARRIPPGDDGGRGSETP